MKFGTFVKSKLPTLKNSLLAIFSAILLILAFPDFDFWVLAWFALVPLFFAVEREKKSFAKSFAVGWIFGTTFFLGTCWWLAFPMYTYAGFPAPIAYVLVLLASLTVGIIPAIFAGVSSIFLKRFGTRGIFAVPFLWTATEFLRFYITGNNWNAIAYSQAFDPQGFSRFASVGGIYLVGFLMVFYQTWFFFIFKEFRQLQETIKRREINWRTALLIIPVLYSVFIFTGNSKSANSSKSDEQVEHKIIAIQPNVPMSGLKYEDWQRLRERHVQLSEQALKSERFIGATQSTTTVIFPESPMNFAYTRDREFQQFLKDFTAKNNVSVLFNAAEPAANDGIYNSAVLVNERGEKIARYDKIHLLPFGEFVPFPEPLAKIIPPVVGNFEFGENYDLLPFGNDIKAGTMICFESHFPTLSRIYALKGADVIVEMTNDGYLGDTGVLRQHLANAVFRAIETNRPVLRVTNVGITAFINEHGEILDATESYREDTRIWTISKSDGKQTFYVKYGDWFAWFCVIIGLVFLTLSFWKKPPQEIIKDEI